MMRRLSWHVGTTVFASIAVTLMVLVGLDSVGAIIDQSADVTRNYFFASKGRWLSSAGLYMLTPPDP